MPRRPRTVIPVDFRNERARARARAMRQAAISLGPARRRRGREGTWRQAFAELRPVLLLIALATAATIHQTPGYYDAPAFLRGEAETIATRFHRCHDFSAGACVIDGDTFHLGERRIRVVGIDTAEVDARCPAEAMLAALSIRALQEWLNRGPFVMTARIDNPYDRYGRELQTLERIAPDGSVDRLATYMRERGGARSYGGGGRDAWC